MSGNWLSPLNPNALGLTEDEQPSPHNYVYLYGSWWVISSMAKEAPHYMDDWGMPLSKSQIYSTMTLELFELPNGPSPLAPVFCDSSQHRFFAVDRLPNAEGVVIRCVYCRGQWEVSQADYATLVARQGEILPGAT